MSQISSADGYQCQTKLTQWVMAVLSFNFTESFVICEWLLPATVSTWPHAVTLCSVIENTWHKTLVSGPHPSITAPSAHLQLDYSWLAERGLHLTWTWVPTSDKKWELWSQYTHISPHCPQVMSVLFQFCVWPKMETWGSWWMQGLSGQWPTWMLACDWWLHPSLQCHYSKDIK